MILATKTLDAIEEAIRNDQGASFRGWLGQTIPHMDDAYRTDEFPFRSHMGASLIGSKCARAIWYGFRWTTRPEFDGRLLRLFNRGHLEEARFLAMLLMVGSQVYNQDENGKQFRISDAGGHFGGSGDGVAINIPDVPGDVPILLEFKTSGDKPFQKLKKEGVKEAKFEHYVQMNVYMRKMAIPVALYMCVNKNNDELHAEIVHFDPETADQYIGRGVKLVFMNEEPEKISNTPSWFECKWCDHAAVCHRAEPPERTCRSCTYALVGEDGNWHCRHPDHVNPALTKEEQLEACNNYTRLF